MLGVRRPVDAASIRDLSDIIKNAKMRVIIHFQKLYVMENAFNGSKNMFGIILTITHIEIIQHEMISQIEVSSEEEEIQEPTARSRDGFGIIDRYSGIGTRGSACACRESSPDYEGGNCSHRRGSDGDLGE